MTNIRKTVPAVAIARVGLGILAASLSTVALAQSSTSWRTPAPVDNVAGGCPIESPDALTLFTAGGFDGTLDIWTNARESKRAPFAPRAKVAAPVSLDDANDFCPTPLARGWLLFVSDRPGDDSCGGADIFLGRSEPTKSGDEFAPRRLGCAPHGPNTEGRELAPAIVATREGIYLYYSTNGPAGDQDIYRSLMEIDGSFGPGEPVTELNTSFNDQQPNVSADGEEIVFSSNRAGAGQDVFIAERRRIDGKWRKVRNLSKKLNFPTVDGNETRASLSADGRRLYYGSGGTIFVAKRRGRSGR